MLLCSIEDVSAGMVVGAAVLNPRRPDQELLVAGVTLEASLITRLRDLGVPQIWVIHEAVEDLNHLVNPALNEVRIRTYHSLKEDFQQMAARTVTSTAVAKYRQIILETICELISGKTAALTDMLFASQGDQFTHAANVAYLSLLVGMELETYVVHERSRMPSDQARDMAGLGIGAMLHDIGKCELDEEAMAYHDVCGAGGAARPEKYTDHCEAGYRMLRGSRAPASATQCVLNHHQRFDGLGFPDMSNITEQRRSGVQRGREIHVFSRIVAVANALDNLLSDADGGRRPPVAALHALVSGRFEGWFDPVVVNAIARAVPPFPMGCQVKLSDGHDGVVVAPNLDQPCSPAVRLLDESSRGADGKYPTLDLTTTPDTCIVACAGHNVRPWLFTLAPRDSGRQHVCV